MRTEHLWHISDPVSGHPLRLISFFEQDGHVMSGIVEADASWYPIIKGVPRLLTGPLRRDLLQKFGSFLEEYRHKISNKAAGEWQNALDEIEDWNRFNAHQKKTGESFAYEWENIYRENDYEKNNFLHFLSPYVAEGFIKDKIVLDIGCGSGRFTKQAALLGAKVAFATDVGESVDVAFGMTKQYENVCVIQADIYAMPFTKTIDLAYSIGVLHHLPEPKNGFLALPKVLKSGGKMLIWVYNRRGNKRALYFYEPLRAVIKHLPKPAVFKLSYVPGLFVHGINFFTHLFREWGWEEAAIKVPFSYYANFPFNMKLNDAFDVLATPKSNYYFVEQIRDWFESAKFSEIKAYEHPEAGITCIGSND